MFRPVESNKVICPTCLSEDVWCDDGYYTFGDMLNLETNKIKSLWVCEKCKRRFYLISKPDYIVDEDAFNSMAEEA